MIFEKKLWDIKCVFWFSVQLLSETFLILRRTCACAILSSVACSSLQYFSTLYHKLNDFRKKIMGHKMCVLIFSTSFVWNISHSKKNWARYDQKCLVIFMSITRNSSPVLMKFQFSRQFFFRKIFKYQISWKSVQWEPSCSMRTDKHDGANSRFSQFC